MKKKPFKIFKDAWKDARKDWKPYTILLIALACLIAWSYLGRPETYYALTHTSQFAPPPQTGSELLDPAVNPAARPQYSINELYAACYVYAAAFFFLALLPFIALLVFKEKPVKYGLRLPEGNAGWIIYAAWIPIALLLMRFVGSTNADYQAIYPNSRYLMSIPHSERLWLFVIFSSFHLLYYFTWEFFFRGVIQRTVSKQWGAPIAILFQVFVSSIIHVGNPAGYPKTWDETTSGALMALLWGILVWKEKSITVPILMHATVGIALDAFICFAM